MDSEVMKNNALRLKFILFSIHKASIYYPLPCLRSMYYLILTAESLAHLADNWSKRLEWFFREGYKLLLLTFQQLSHSEFRHVLNNLKKNIIISIFF